MVSDEEKRVILDLALGKLSLSDFYARYPAEISGDGRYVSRQLSDALANRDSETLEYMFYLRAYHHATEPMDSHLPILRILLLEDWHNQHEYIVDALEALEDKQSIDGLSERAIQGLDHLDPLDNESLKKKCAYAIARLGGSEARQALGVLGRKGTEEVRELAARLLRQLSADEQP